jgi:hypothetical protein
MREFVAQCMIVVRTTMECVAVVSVGAHWSCALVSGVAKRDASADVSPSLFHDTA